jgi:GNAT superfamily N-acetyltransferase
MNIILRAVTADDVDFLYNLHCIVMQTYVVQTWGQWDEAWQSQYFRQHFNPAACQIIMFQRQDVGMIRVEHRSKDIFLSKIEMLPPHQGHGIGTYLVRARIDEASHRGVPLSLQVLKVNPARKL